MPSRPGILSRTVRAFSLPQQHFAAFLHHYAEADHWTRYFDILIFRHIALGTVALLELQRCSVRFLRSARAWLVAAYFSTRRGLGRHDGPFLLGISKFRHIDVPLPHLLHFFCRSRQYHIPLRVRELTGELLRRRQFEER